MNDRKARERSRREQDILEAALRLFRGDDWQGVTIEQIAVAAEVGKGTIYKHFDSKDEVYARLAADFHERVLGDLRALDRSGEVPARFRLVLMALLRAYGAAGTSLRRVLEHCDRRGFLEQLPERSRRRLGELEAATDGIIEEILEVGVSQRLFPRKSKALLAFGAKAALHGAIRAIEHGDVSRDEAEEHFAELANFVLAGLMYQGRLREEPAAS